MEICIVPSEIAGLGQLYLSVHTHTQFINARRFTERATRPRDRLRVGLRRLYDDGYDNFRMEVASTPGCKPLTRSPGLPTNHEPFGETERMALPQRAKTCLVLVRSFPPRKDCLPGAGTQRPWLRIALQSSRSRRQAQGC
jgi:hypothetical protein